MPTSADQPTPTKASPIEVTVTFSSPTGPVSGTVGRGGSASSFHGWLELMDALEAERAGGSALSPPPAP
jgi:hypothetical protein